MKHVTNKPGASAAVLEPFSLLRRGILQGAALGSAAALLGGVRAGARGRNGPVPRPSTLAFGVRQPRHDQPVLCAHPVRASGRLRPAGLRPSMDRFRELGRGGNGQRHERGDRRQGRRHCNPADRSKGLQRPDGAGARRGHPVFSYNADAPPGSANKRLAYIGQDLYQAGALMGQRITKMVDGGQIALFIATPGALNLQPASTAHRTRSKSLANPTTYRSSQPARLSTRRSQRSNRSISAIRM